MDEAPISPERMRWLVDRSVKRIRSRQDEKVKTIRRNARGGVKHAEGSTKPSRDQRRTVNRKKAKGAKASRRRNR